MKDLHALSGVEGGGSSLLQQMQQSLYVVEESMTLCDPNEYLLSMSIYHENKKGSSLCLPRTGSTDMLRAVSHPVRLFLDLELLVASDSKPYRTVILIG